MKRSEFIKKSLLATGGTLLIPSFLKGVELLPTDTKDYKRLVVIQFSGGNDGLNTVVPYSNDVYHKLRPGIGLSAKEVLRLNEDVGLNPGLTGLRNLYDKGFLQVINAVGYPNPNRSHFRSMDIWNSGSDARDYVNTGWLGRYLDSECQHNYEVMQVSDSLSLAVKGADKKGLAVSDFRKLYLTTKEDYFDALTQKQKVETDNENLHYLYKTLIETKSSSDYIFETAKTYTNTVSYPANPFGKQLKNVATFINSGLKTKVYYVTLGGFDTHVFQKGKHERLLKQYSDAVEIFVNDLKANNRLDDTLIMTFSEFGRRPKQNASQGTDHGTANNVFVIGSKLKKPGLFNEMADLKNLDDNNDLKHTVDFRSIYASMLEDWLGVNSNLLMNYKGSKLDLL